MQCGQFARRFPKKAANPIVMIARKMIRVDPVSDRARADLVRLRELVLRDAPTLGIEPLPNQFLSLRFFQGHGARQDSLPAGKQPHDQSLSTRSGDLSTATPV